MSRNKKRKKDIDKSKQLVAENAIKKIADREGVTPDYVKTQIQISMMNGLCSTDPTVKAFWASVPREKEVPTPEELIIYISENIKRKGLI